MILIEYLNQPFNSAGFLWVFVAIAVWLAIWYLFLGRLLEKCDYNSIGYTMYEFGPFGTMMILVFIGIVLIMIISLIQLIIKGGIKY